MRGFSLVYVSKGVFGSPKNRAILGLAPLFSNLGDPNTNLQIGLAQEQLYSTNPKKWWVSKNSSSGVSDINKIFDSSQLKYVSIK